MTPPVRCQANLTSAGTAEDGRWLRQCSRPATMTLTVRDGGATVGAVAGVALCTFHGGRCRRGVETRIRDGGVDYVLAFPPGSVSR